MGSIDWLAPVEPGRGMLGLTLGQSLSSVRAMFGESGSSLTFSNSPRLTADLSKSGVILLRAVDLNDRKYDWQDVLARLLFEGDELTSIVVLGDRGHEALAYKGKLFGEVALGSPVSELLRFGEIEYDDVEEVFFSNQWSGIEVGGAGACDLLTNPGQFVTSFKIYRPK